MSSLELTPFSAKTSIQIVGGLEVLSPAQCSVGFWVRDPDQTIIWPTIQPNSQQSIRQDFLWQQTCFEVFIGLEGISHYREVNLSPTGQWQVYQFDEYRYPDQVPPLATDDIKISQLKQTSYGLNACLDLSRFLKYHDSTLDQLYIGLSAVINTTQTQYYFALQHSGQKADFHNKHDWILRP